MDMRPAKPYRDEDFEQWMRWAGTMFLSIVVACLFFAPNPDIGTFFAATLLAIPVAAIGGLTLMTLWNIIKILFE